MSDSLALAHANALVHELQVGLDYSGTQRPAIIRRISDLIAWSAAIEHENSVLAAENAEAKDAVLRQAARLAALESELATLQASVVDALSSAGPSEDERTA